MTRKDGTTEQWAQYEKEKKAFDERMEREKPHFLAPRSKHDEWEMARSCDAPNKPGYYRANND